MSIWDEVKNKIDKDNEELNKKLEQEKRLREAEAELLESYNKSARKILNEFVNSDLFLVEDGALYWNYKIILEVGSTKSFVRGEDGQDNYWSKNMGIWTKEYAPNKFQRDSQPMFITTDPKLFRNKLIEIVSEFVKERNLKI